MPGTKKTASKTTTPKVSAPQSPKYTQTVVLQYGPKNIDIEAVIMKIKETAEPAKSLSVYFKPEDDKAYYVADGAEGSIEL